MAADEMIQIRDKAIRQILIERAQESGASGYTEVFRRAVLLGLAVDELLHPGPTTNKADVANDAIVALMPILREIGKYADFRVSIGLGGPIPQYGPPVQTSTQGKPTYQTQAQPTVPPTPPPDYEAPLTGSTADFDE